MAASIEVTNLPDSVRARYEKQDVLDEVLMAKEVPRQYQRNSEDVQQLKFPSTKTILWDHAPIGDPYTLHISYYRPPRLSVSEKLLRFAQRHVESTGQKNCGCVLVGTVAVDDDGEGLKFMVERLDPAWNPNSSTNHAAGDMLIPFTVQNGCKERNSSVEDYCNAIQMLQQRCSSKDPVELSNFLLTKGWCSFYTNGDKCVHHLEFDVVTMGTEIKAVPLEPVPIIPTALSKNLSGPMSISHMQGVPKTGYLTMDHTRKILLVLESDPKVASLPLVGIWVSGVTHVYSPFVWACCLRYLHNSSIQDRVCSPPDPFLLVLYNPTHSKPEFYECSTANGSSQMTFNFYTGYEAVQLSKSGVSAESIELELDRVDSGSKFDQFDMAVHSVLKNSREKANDTVRSQSPDSAVQEDITPRLKPAPHQSKMELMQSMVPEVSLFFGDDETLVPNIQHPKGLPYGPRFPGHKPHTQHPPAASSSRAVSQVEARSVPNREQNGHVSDSLRSSQAEVRVTSSTNGNSAAVSSARTVNGYMPAHVGNPSQPIRPPEPTVSTPYSQPPHSMYPSSHPHPGYPSVSYPMGPTQGLRPPPCNCPGCQKSQFYSSPLPCDIRGPGPRPVYSHSAPYLPRGPAPPHTYPYQPVVSQGYPGHYPPHQAPAPYLPQPPVQHPHYPDPNNKQYSAPHSVHQQQLAQGIYPTSKSGPAPSTSDAPHITQEHRAPPGPTASQGLPVVSEIRSKSPRTPANSGDYETRSTSRRSTDSEHHQNSHPGSDNSGRSSDDSGLSFTPEKHNSPSTTATVDAKPTQKTDSAVVDSKSNSASTLTGINWSSVPPEIYQLLQQQNEQLKQLQAQIEVLTAQQSLNNTAASQESLKLQPSKQAEMCTAATNTSMVQDKQQVSACIQTSLQKSYNSSQSSSNGSGCDPRTPMEIRHRGKLPMNSTQREDLDLDISQGELVALMNNMQDKTIDSVQSDMIVDLPSYQSSPTRSPRSQDSYSESSMFNSSPRSPISASMCEGDADDSCGSDTEDVEDNTAGTDNPEYYNKLMDNIKKLLSQNTTEEDTYYPQDDTTQMDDTPVKLAHDRIELGAQLQSFMMMNQSTRATTDTTFIPKINYVSMFLDSDTDTSMEINAMAMKYLKDEQLTQLTKLQAKNRLINGTKKSNEKTALLQKILKAEDDTTPNVTTFGMSENNMTFNTKRYMEKHGLLDGTTSNGSTTPSEATYDSSYRLKTNYSTMSSGSEDGPTQITQEVLGTPGNRSRTPVSNTQTPESGKTLQNSYKSTPSQPTRDSDSRFTDSLSRTPRPDFNRSGLGGHRRLTPSSVASHNASRPYNHSSPYEQQLGNNTNRDNNLQYGANYRHASPLITPAPSRPKHSPPEREVSTPQHKTTKAAAHDCSPAFVQRAEQRPRAGPAVVENQANYYSSRPHREETHDDDRILDITRLKQLPKLL